MYSNPRGGSDTTEGVRAAPLPFSIYGSPGGLSQCPRRAGKSSINGGTGGRGDLGNAARHEHHRRTGGGLRAGRRAAIAVRPAGLPVGRGRSVADRPGQRVFCRTGAEPARLDLRGGRPPRGGPQAACRPRTGGPGAGHGDPPARQPAPCVAQVRAGPLPGPHGPGRRRGTGLRRSPRADRPVGGAAAHRLALAGRRTVLRRHACRPDGRGQPPQVPLEPRTHHRRLGRGIHPRWTRGRRDAG